MRRVPRAFAAATGVVVFAAGCSLFGGSGDRSDPENAFRRYVDAWTGGSAALGRTITGDESVDLVEALSGLGDGEVVDVVARDVTRDPEHDDTVEAVASLRFADRGRLDLAVRARVAKDRVVAEPSAVSTALARWAPLRIERFGAAPERGDISSRTGTVLARGPKGGRSVARPALQPATTLVDDALDARLAGHVGRRLFGGARVLAEQAPAGGEDVRTSIDDAMQTAAEAALGEAPGAFVAVDPRTGGIRALVSNPTARAPGAITATAAYSPGSAFKIVTAAAALEGGVFAPADRVDCPARLALKERVISNFESISYGSITFEKALAVSCNTAFGQIGIRVGTTRLLRTAERLGFRVVPRLDGPGTIAVPRSDSELAVWSFGAAGSLVSPVQMAGIGSAIARGGTWIEPGWTDRDERGRRVLEEGTAGALLAMMEEVVASGTGTAAQVPGATVAGKTGTADPTDSPGATPTPAGAPAGGPPPSDAWFVGLAPSPGSRLAAVALLAGGGVGGEAAAPVVQQFLVATMRDWGSQ